MLEVKGQAPSWASSSESLRIAVYPKKLGNRPLRGFLPGGLLLDKL